MMKDFKLVVFKCPLSRLQRLRHLQGEMVEAREAAKETEVLLRMWETLVSRAHQMPSVSVESLSTVLLTSCASSLFTAAAH